MDDKGHKQDDFESTIPINLSKLDPYQKPDSEPDSARKDEAEKLVEDFDKSAELQFVDLDAELDAIDAELDSVEKWSTPSLEEQMAKDEALAQAGEDQEDDNINQAADEIVDFDAMFDAEEFNDIDFEMSDIDAGDQEQTQKTEVLVANTEDAQAIPIDETSESDALEVEFDADLAAVDFPEVEVPEPEVSEPAVPEADKLSEELARELPVDTTEEVLEDEEEFETLIEAREIVEDSEPVLEGTEADQAEKKALDSDEEIDDVSEPFSSEMAPEMTAEATEDKKDNDVLDNALDVGTDHHSRPMHVSAESNDSNNPTGTSEKNTSSPLAVLLAVSGIAIAGFSLWSVSQLEQQVAALKMQAQDAAAQIQVYQLQAAQQTQMVAELEAQKAETQKSEAPKTQKLTVVSVPARLAAQPSEKTITPHTKVVQISQPKSSGVWLVNVSSEQSPAQAKRVQQGLKKAGVESVVKESVINGRIWYRVQITGFDTKQAAKDYMKTFEAEQGLKGMWVAQGK